MGLFNDPNATPGQKAARTAAGTVGAILTQPTGIGAFAGHHGAKLAQNIIAREKSRFGARKEARDMLAADVATLKNRPWELGLTESEKRQRESAAAAAAGAQAGAQMAGLSQMALGGQGFQQGAFTGATQKVQEEAQKAVVEERARVEKESRDLAAREADRIRAELSGEAERQDRVRAATREKILAGVGALGAAIHCHVNAPLLHLVFGSIRHTPCNAKAFVL